MKALKLFLLGLLVVGSLFYVNSLIPQPQQAQATVYPSTSVNTEDGMMNIHPVEVIGSNGSSYRVDFKLTSLTGHALQTTVVTHNFFCPNLSGDGKCYENGTQNTQTITVPAGSYVDAWSETATPAMANGQFSNCGLYQIDLGLSYPGAHNHATYQAAGGFNTGKVCTAHPTPTPTSTPTQHAECRQNACIEVPGTGSNQCTSNSDCQTVTPTLTPTVTPSITPSITPTQVITCFNSNNQLIQVGINDIALCNNNTQINNNYQTVTVNQQQQQQQAVLAASVAPAVSTSQLPATGSGTDILFTLAGLLPIGFKLRKLV